MTFWISSMATTMLAVTPSSICCRGQFAEIAQRRPAIVVDQDIGVRAGGEQRLLAFGVVTSAATAVTLAPVAAGEFGGGGFQFLRRRGR